MGQLTDGSGGVTYTSQGESPLVDFVRQVLNSCGMSRTVQQIAPGQRRVESAREVEGRSDDDNEAD